MNNENNETTQTEITDNSNDNNDKEIDTSVLEIPSYGYNQQFNGKKVRFIQRGTFWSVPSEIENQNLDKARLNSDGKLLRYWAKLDKTYTVTRANDETIEVEALMLTVTQNDKLTRLGNTKTSIDDLFKDGHAASLVVCKVNKKSGIGSFWDLLTGTQYREKFNKDPEM